MNVSHHMYGGITYNKYKQDNLSPNYNSRRSYHLENYLDQIRG